MKLSLILFTLCNLLAGFILGAWYYGHMGNLETTFCFCAAVFAGAFSLFEVDNTN